MTTPSSFDSDVVERARRGERAALEEVLTLVAPSIHRFGLRMCRNPHDADDVLQDTLLAVANHIGAFEGRSSLSSWVFALTRSACARRRRGLKNRPPAGDESIAEAVDPSPSPESRAAEQEILTALGRALDGLTDEYREVILLRDVEGLAAAEAAPLLGVSVDALKSRLHRAREALREALRPMLEPAMARPSSTCPDVVALWSQMLEGDLSQRDCATMEKHLVGCPACGAACDALKRALVACQGARTVDVPPHVVARVKEAMQAWAAGRDGLSSG